MIINFLLSVLYAADTEKEGFPVLSTHVKIFTNADFQKLRNWSSIEKYGKNIPWEELSLDQAIPAVTKWWPWDRTQPASNCFTLEFFSEWSQEDNGWHPKTVKTYNVLPFYLKDTAGKFMYVLLEDDPDSFSEKEKYFETPINSRMTFKQS